MTQPDIYLLGRGPGEEERLKRQIADLAPVSDAQLVKIGIRPGERVVDLGCGPGGVLHLLGKHVGPAGSVLGIDRSAHFVESARRFAADLGLTQVEIRQGDAYDTGLPRASFDGAHARLVLVTVPKPELIVRELVSLVRREVGSRALKRTSCRTTWIRPPPNIPACWRPSRPMRRRRESIPTWADAPTAFSARRD